MKHLLTTCIAFILCISINAQLPTDYKSFSRQSTFPQSEIGQRISSRHLHFLLANIMNTLRNINCDPDTIWALNKNTISFKQNNQYYNVGLKINSADLPEIGSTLRVNDRIIDFMVKDSRKTLVYPYRIDFVDTIYRKPGQDSIFYQKAGIEYAIIDSTCPHVDLGVTQSATTVTVTNTAGASAVIQEATESVAGILLPAEKIKLNRIFPFLNYNELRTVTNPDTAIIYLDASGNQFRYDPDDMTSTDDSATLIVTSGGARLKRVFRGIYRPEDFGAKGDGITDDWWPWQKMMNFIQASGKSGSVWCDARANYKIDPNSVVLLPVLGGGKTLYIHGNGAKMTGKYILRRRPPSQGDALNVYQGVKIVINNLNFQATSLDNSIAVDMGATYGAEVSHCNFTAFDSALVFRFGLNSTSRQNLFTSVKNGVVFTYGGVWGGSTTNSQSNASVSEQDRIYGHTTGFAAIIIEAASDCEIKNVVIEGHAMDYGVYYDNRGATVVKGIAINGAHIEYATGPDRAAFYIRGDGQFEISNVYIQVCDTFLIAPGLNYKEIFIRNIPWWPNNCLIACENPSAAFKFLGLPANFKVTSTCFAIGGNYSMPHATNIQPNRIFVSKGTFLLTDSSDTVRGIGLVTSNNGAARIYGGHLLYNEDNQYNIGFHNGRRPRDIFVARNIWTDTVANNRIGWHRSEAQGPDTYFQREEKGFISLSGKGGFRLPMGNTSERPETSPTGTIRYTTDSTGLEYRDSTSWKQIASKEWVNNNFNSAATSTSGSYVPTISMVQNISNASIDSCYWVRNGNVITVTGQVSITASSGSTMTVLAISVPIESQLDQAFHCNGVANMSALSGYSGTVEADLINDKAELRFMNGSDTGNARTWKFTFTYFIKGGEQSMLFTLH